MFSIFEGTYALIYLFEVWFFNRINNNNNNSNETKNAFPTNVNLQLEF